MAGFPRRVYQGLRHQLRQRLPSTYDARINERIALFDMEGEVVRSFVPDAFLIEKSGGGHYYAFVSRADHRPNCQVYHWGIRQSLPTIAIPLKRGDPDVLIELSAAFRDTYERGGYENDIDYSTQLSVPLGESDVEWALRQTRAAQP